MPTTPWDPNEGDARRWFEFTTEELDELSAMFQGAEEYHVNYRLACDLERQIERELASREVCVEFSSPCLG
ncbi:hypothetical protein EF910_05350 [Streptomyces sp. WAC07149]|uniref:hypothetical protein n=1 Tax=Streptomyces sp. WAC07149 TaxID=2487425 RepID=UPI000F77766B|nr:hypothetical protein [Streptomyces sp. WAC07149]RST07865.1 hypothetical protein EF910_05350 [Streptomyces sp. WAC07149]